MFKKPFSNYLDRGKDMNKEQMYEKIKNICRDLDRLEVARNRDLYKSLSRQDLDKRINELEIEIIPKIEQLKNTFEAERCSYESTDQRTVEEQFTYMLRSAHSTIVAIDLVKCQKSRNNE